MKRHIIALTAAIAVLTSCEKDDKKDTNQPPVKSKSEILTDRQWDVDYFYTKTTIMDTTAFEDTDTINGTALFKSNNQVLINTPGEGPQTSTWEIKGDSIYIDDEGMYIEKLTDTQFIFSIEETSAIPDSIPVPFTVYMRFTMNR